MPDIKRSIRYPPILWLLPDGPGAILHHVELYGHRVQCGVAALRLL